MFGIRRLPLVQQTLICVIALCLLIAITSSIALYSHTTAVADKAALNALQTQTNLVTLSLEYVEKNIPREALSELKRLDSLLPPARLTGRTVTVGGTTIPELIFGENISGVSNQAYLLAYKAENPTNEVAFVVRAGNKLYRSTTLLKSDSGQYRDGTVMTDSYVEKVIAGQMYLGTTWRSGKLYALAMRPLKDKNGQVIGAISMRIAVDEEIDALKNRMASIVLGKTGYPTIINVPFGDRKEADFFLHPTLSGKRLAAAPDIARDFFQKILDQKNGALSYEWPAKNGGMEKKIAVFREISTLHWIIVTSAPMAEYTETYTGLARYVLIGLAGLVLLLVLSLWGIIRYQLHPIERLVQALACMGKGDLTHALTVEPDSRNEIDVLAASINDSREAMKKLVGDIRESSSTVDDAASGSLKDIQELSSNVGHLSTTSSEVSRSIEELSTAISQVAHAAETANGCVEETVGKVARGKEVVLGVIDSIQVVESRVQSTIMEVQRLTEHSRDIETVVASIGAIAAQTNLLALNAAIEAARAGEVGRGFAVVADEVRKLAEQSANSADEIYKILNDVTTGVDAVHTAIGAVVEETQKGTQASSTAGEALSDIEQITHALVDNVNTIAESATEQSSAAQSMAAQVATTARIVCDTDKVARAVSKTTEGLKEEADKLYQEVGYFKV